MSTPKEVLRAIRADWKLCGYSYTDAADMLGYANRQSLITFMYRLRKAETFFPKKHANKFHAAFGYDIMFLMEGIGELYPLHDHLDLDYSEIDGDPLCNFTDDQLLPLLQIASSIIGYSSDEKSRDAWQAILGKSLKKYCKNMRFLIQRSTGKFIPGQDLLFLAERLCR